MLQNDMFVGGQFAWFIGEVRDVSDPNKSNRVRVLPFGYYDSTIEKEHLPWATVMMPNTFASMQGIGGNHQLMVGSWVIGFFRDGNSAQDPVIMGTFASQTDGISDLPIEVDEHYPNNKVHKTEGLHIVEFDNEPGEERIEITHKDLHKFKMTGAEIEIRHKSGTVININEEGTVLIDAVNDVVNIDGNTTITGTLTVSDATTLQDTLAVSGTQNNESTITASGEITSGSVTLTGHTHKDTPGLGAGTTTTGSG
tara:strand:+ start:333 stop:1094 length:762 start_codon:yes stop_codon:yes gene_type:complete